MCYNKCIEFFLVPGCAYCNVSGIASNLRLTYGIIQNNPPQIVGQLLHHIRTLSHYVKIELINTGTSNILSNGDDWKLMLCHKGLIASNRFNPLQMQYLTNTSRGNFALSYLKGCLYEFKPLSTVVLAPNKPHSIIFKVDGEIQSAYDLYPNAYITDGLNSAAIPGTSSIQTFMKPMDSYFQKSIAPMFTQVDTETPQKR